MGWALGSHAGPLSAAAVDSSGRGAFPLLGDSASKCAEAVLFFLPPHGGFIFLLLLVLFGTGIRAFGYCV